MLILAHVKELLQQAADKLNAICPELPFGIYSAGLGMRNTQEPVIIAGIQSVFRLAKKLGHFDLVIVDEAHMILEQGIDLQTRACHQEQREAFSPAAA